MKTSVKRIIACALALCLGLSLIACDITTPQNETEKVYAYIAIDINPSVELVVADGVVESVRAVNDDASVLLSGEDLTGLTAEQAAEKIVALSEELGYLNEDNDDVKLTVIADDDEIATEIEEKAKTGAKKGSSRAIVNSNPRLADEREVKELKDADADLYKGLSPAKLRLIKSIMEYDPEMTIELGVTIPTKELVELLKEYSNEFKDFTAEELKTRLKERKEEIKAEKQREIAEIYGEDHLNEWNKLEELKSFHKELKELAKNAVLSEEDVTAIIAIIGEENAESITIDGSVSVESVERFVDRFNELTEDAKEQIETILDKYDDDEYALSEDDRKKLFEIAGDVKADMLEDLDGLIDGFEDEIEKQKDEAELDDTQKEAIDNIKDSWKNEFEGVKDEFKAEIENAKEHFEKQKSDRRK